MRYRLLLALLFAAGCSSQPTDSPVKPYDAESARIINQLGISRNSEYGLTTIVARHDLKIEEIDGKVKARLTDEEQNPLIFKAGMSPPEMLRKVEEAEIDENDPLVKRAKEIMGEMEKVSADSDEGAKLKAKLEAEFEKSPGLRQAVQRVVTQKYH